MRTHDLLLQQVFLVKEKDDRGALEPGISDDRMEQSFALLHTILTGNRKQEGWKLEPNINLQDISILFCFMVRNDGTVAG